MLRRLPLGIAIVLVLITTGCGSTETTDTAAARTPSTAEKCTQYVLNALDAAYRPNTSSDAVIFQITNDYGTKSPQYEAFLAALQQSTFVDTRVEDGMAAALEAARPTVSSICAGA